MKRMSKKGSKGPRGPYAKDRRIPLSSEMGGGMRALEVLLLSVIWEHPTSDARSPDDYSDLIRLSKVMEILTGQRSQTVSASDLETAADVSLTAAQTKKAPLNLNDVLRIAVAFRKHKAPKELIRDVSDENEDSDMRRMRKALKKSNFLQSGNSDLDPSLLGAVSIISAAIRRRK